MSGPPSSRGAFVDGAMRRRATREAMARARTASVAPVTETARVGSNARASTSGNARERSTMTTASERARARELGLETPRPGSSLLRGWLAQDYDWTREAVTSELTGNESTEHSLAVQKSYEPELSAPKTVARWFGGEIPRRRKRGRRRRRPALCELVVRVVHGGVAAEHRSFGRHRGSEFEYERETNHFRHWFVEEDDIPVQCAK